MHSISRVSHILLWPFARIFQPITDIRNYLYDSKIIKSASFDLPVISVGNLSVGGTGKSPHIEYLIQLLKYNYQIGTLSRGYGRKSHGFQVADQSATAATMGDEPMLFHVKHPEVLVAVAEERVIGIPRMVSMHPALDVVLLDDAYQHRTIRPGLSILLTEYDAPFWRDHPLPLGWLREARKHYHRADIIIVTKCPVDLSEAERQHILSEIRPYPYQHVYFSHIEYGPLYPLFRTEQPQPPVDIRNSDILLVTGIASHEKLRKHLELTATNVYLNTFKDHHNYDIYDLERIRDTYHNMTGGHKVLVTTEKDAVRLWPFRSWFLENNIPIFVQPIRVAFARGDGPRFDADIIRYIEITRGRNIDQEIKSQNRIDERSDQ
ncbi:MAG: tetraacyldisaccharide 4'-kinase [Bacteroidetes bacterium]|nr:tetraacyldisaccharide 4'-kinase [Bacteroidota bacterium]